MEMEKRLKTDLVKKGFYKHDLKMFSLKYIVLNYINFQSSLWSCLLVKIISSLENRVVCLNDHFKL